MGFQKLPLNDGQSAVYGAKRKGQIQEYTLSVGLGPLEGRLHFSSSHSAVEQSFLRPHIDFLSLRMDLLRLPLIVLEEVFKNMDFREQFLISLMSKRARYTLKLTSAKLDLSINFSDDLYIEAGTNDSPSELTDEVDHRIGGKVMRLSVFPERITLQETSPQTQLSFVGYLLDTFRKPSISVEFHHKALPTSALEFMRMMKQRKLFVNSLYYYIKSDSSEFIPKILDECTEVTDSIWIGGSFPDDFVYTPPRPFKAKEFHVDTSSNWFNLDSFMSCRRVFKLNKPSNQAPESWNTFFRNWLDSDAPLETLWCFEINVSDFPLMVDGLSNGIHKKGAIEWIEVKRRDGSESVIGRCRDDLYIMSKNEHKALFHCETI
uniref:F-box domain-containing protein n=1 Tax=Caenorhabditis tropicalis TaxID=1561998 RepID=A0A1I7UTJ1_9PELO